MLTVGKNKRYNNLFQPHGERTSKRDVLVRGQEVGRGRERGRRPRQRVGTLSLPSLH